jgi:hypothetical protein
MITDRFNGIIATILLVMLVAVIYSSGRALLGTWDLVEVDVNRYLSSAVINFGERDRPDESGADNQLEAVKEPVEFIEYPVYKPGEREPVFGPTSVGQGKESLAGSFEINGGLIPAYRYDGLTDCWQRECRLYEKGYYVNTERN